MPYVCVRGTLGMANTRVYGLNETEAEKITTILRVAEVKDALTVYNAPMYAINQIEYHLGYVVIAATNQDRYTIWTLHKPLPMPQ
ncbi:Hypothetical protein NTJ_06160 [Nesidiocoris tenuis]|uniref:Uncharacterized protein n=1 Tax=Nesidiocoris tenuis TaxID=355587 RepID=A0ABN7AM94_9HEMI|nr:Hypothetical protein NTJ_06160 [Nesidiocoris tenuis]